MAQLGASGPGGYVSQVSAVVFCVTCHLAVHGPAALALCGSRQQVREHTITHSGKVHRALRCGSKNKRLDMTSKTCGVEESVHLPVQARAADEGAAVEEARLAIERLVLPGGGAAELLPRAPGVLVCQVGLGHSGCQPF